LFLQTEQMVMVFRLRAQPKSASAPKGWRADVGGDPPYKAGGASTAMHMDFTLGRPPGHGHARTGQPHRGVLARVPHQELDPRSWTLMSVTGMWIVGAIPEADAAGLLPRLA
jgi:hypothetical protein